MVTELDRHCFWAASLESTAMADQALYIANNGQGDVRMYHLGPFQEMHGNETLPRRIAEVRFLTPMPFPDDSHRALTAQSQGRKAICSGLFPVTFADSWSAKSG